MVSSIDIVCTLFNGLTYYNLTLIILLDINHLFVLCRVVSNITNSNSFTDTFQVLLFNSNNCIQQCCIAVIHIQLYTYTCGNIVNTIMTNEHTSLEKYTSHTLFEMVAKGLCVRAELETEQTATYWPPNSSDFSSTSFLFCWAAQSGVLRAHSPLLVLSTASYLQLTDSKLTEPVCDPGLYNCLTPTCFLWASHLHPIQPVHSQAYTLISSTGWTCSSIDGWVEGQYVTTIIFHLYTVKWFKVSLCNNNNSI